MGPLRAAIRGPSPPLSPHPHGSQEQFDSTKSYVAIDLDSKIHCMKSSEFRQNHNLELVTSIALADFDNGKNGLWSLLASKAVLRSADMIPQQKCLDQPWDDFAAWPV